MKKTKKPSLSQKALGSIRIIAGKFRGKKLPVLSAEGLRPTTDRVKETLFNWLMGYVPDAKVLDCFAGSGGLGFEALSRGAKLVTFVELNPKAAELLRSNSAQLSQQNDVLVVQKNCLDYLNNPPQSGEGVDIAFVDPPFRQQLVAPVCELLNNGWLNTGALIYVEMASDESSAFPPNWQCIKEKTAGQVVYRLFEYQGDH